MGRRGYYAAFWLLMAVPVVAMGAARAATFDDCVRDGANRNFEAKTAFQRDLRDLIARNRPEFEPLATISMELQFLLAEARLAKVDYLLRHDAHRIDTTKGLARFSNFEWSEADSAKFGAENGSFAELERRISTLRKRNDKHPDWPDLRAYFRTEMAQSPDYMAIMAQLQTRLSDVEKGIAECHHD